MNDLNIPDLPDRRGFKPFTRVLQVPPGWPWDQSRVAALEARHTSPVTGDDVTVIVRRLQPWRLRETGRFVAIYLRGADIRQGLNFDVEVQGRRFTIDMPSPAARAEQTQQGAWRLGLAMVMVLCILGMGALTVQRRTAEAQRLTELETQMTRRVREATGVARARADANALARLGLSNRTMDNALADLRTLSLQRDTAARLDAFYWNKGYWAVEVRGSEAPVKDATVPLQRSARPVRKGAWLWVSAVEDGAR